VIHENPAVGIEPFANVPELQASVRLSSLWTGRLEFSTVRFVEPSINLVKPDRGAWNLAPLVAGAASQTTVRLPEIRITEGRLNFKFGDVKSPFYLTGADVVVSPSAGGLNLRFSLAPARTDRSSAGYGTFKGRGRWAGGRIDLDVELERSSVEELVTLARGQSLGLHGSIESRAKVSGPVANAQITGWFELEDVHRWDLIQGHTGSVRMNYRGSMDLSGQRLDLVADGRTNPTIPVSLRLAISELLHNPNWVAEVAVSRMPAGALVEAARHMGAPLPGGLLLEGEAAGVIGYSSAAGMQGQITVRQAGVQIDKGARFDLPQASVLIAGDELRLLPATLSGQSRAAQFEAVYAPFRQRLRASITGRGLPVADLQDGRGHLLNGAAVPIAGRLRGGVWTGTLNYVSDADEPGRWTARLHVKDTSTQIPGLGVPLRILAADVEVDGDALAVRRMRASVGSTELYGQYRYDPLEDRPHRFALTMPSVNLEELEESLLPTLRREGSFLARTLRWRTGRAPEWLRERRAEGTVRVGTLTAGDLTFRALRSRVIWNGAAVQFPNLQCRLGDATVHAVVAADLSRAEPAYKLRGSIREMEWRGGEAELEGSLTTSGTGIDALAALRAEGKYELRAVTMAPDFVVRTATGAFDFAASRTGPQVKLTVAQAAAGADRFTGEGATMPDGRLNVDLASGPRVMRLTGPMIPLKLELTQDRTSTR
jgi:hypothetical protein